MNIYSNAYFKNQYATETRDPIRRHAGANTEIFASSSDHSISLRGLSLALKKDVCD